MNDLLQRVRVAVLRKAALYSKRPISVSLGEVVDCVDPKRKVAIPGQYRIGAPRDGQRGNVQACLAQLALEGIMYSRRKPEPGRFSGERCDKHFRIRISAADALRRLPKADRLEVQTIIENRAKQVPWPGSAYLTKTLIHALNSSRE